jgi:hypothetical protein
MNISAHSKSKNVASVEQFLLLLCFIVGIVLRVGNPMDLSFINDELSTWSKVSYDSVGAVIENIKLVDSHPVGMYVFVYYWTLIFGTSEWAIKLPFLLMSIASLFFVYRLGSLWFSKTVGLLVLAYFSTLQFPIWWSHIARQYQSGLFCTLVMGYCWTQLLLEKQTEKRYWLGFVLMGAASMYNHYFSFIFAGFLGLGGFVWMRKEILLKYIAAGVSMLLLFLPHVSITSYQLQNADGHLWYNIPTPSFFSNHIQYIFHYSHWCLGWAILLLIGSLLIYGKETFKQHKKARCVSVFLFAAPILFGYLYSVYQSPILRESHLLFSLPYLLFFWCSFFPKNLSSKSKVVLVVLILLVNTLTLVITRKHYETVHTHPYEHFIKHTKAFLAEHDNKEVSIVLGENPAYLQYYKDAYQTNFKHVESFKPSISFLEFREILENSVTSYLIVGSIPEAHLQMAMNYYPYLYEKSYGINYEYYILSKEKQPGKSAWEFDYKTNMDFRKLTKKGWQVNASKIKQDSITENYYYEQKKEWGPKFEMNLDQMTPRNNEFLDVAIDVRVADSLLVQPKGTFVLELRNEQDSLLVWKGVDAVAQTTLKKGWQRLYLSLRFAHEPIYDNVKKLKIKAFYWNREKQATHLDRFSITTRKGNALLYKDTNPVEFE